MTKAKGLRQHIEHDGTGAEGYANPPTGPLTAKTTSVKRERKEGKHSVSGASRMAQVLSRLGLVVLS